MIKNIFHLSKFNTCRCIYNYVFTYICYYYLTHNKITILTLRSEAFDRPVKRPMFLTLGYIFYYLTLVFSVQVHGRNHAMFEFYSFKHIIVLNDSSNRYCTFSPKTKIILRGQQLYRKGLFDIEDALTAYNIHTTQTCSTQLR